MTLQSCYVVTTFALYKSCTYIYEILVVYTKKQREILKIELRRLIKMLYENLHVRVREILL